MLHENDVKEELSRVYLHAVATSLGYSVDRPTNDRDSVDAKICTKGKLTPESLLYSPSLEVQLKSTSQQYDGEEITYKLPIKNYDDLRAFTMTPRFLMLLLLPENIKECVQWSPNELLLKGQAYWTSLSGRESSENSSSQTIVIKKTNRFNPKSLEELMILASKDRKIPYEL